MQQVPLMRAEGAISSLREVRDLEGSSVRAAPSQRSFPRLSGVPVFFHTHTCSNKSSLLFSAHADHEVPLQMRLLSWSAGVQIFAISLFSPAVCRHEAWSKGQTLVVRYSALLLVCLGAAAALLGHVVELFSIQNSTAGLWATAQAQ